MDKATTAGSEPYQPLGLAPNDELSPAFARAVFAGHQKHQVMVAFEWLRDIAADNDKHQPLAGYAFDAWHAAITAALAQHKALRAVMLSDVGRQTLQKLAEGQGTNTEDGRAWLDAAQALGLNVRAKPPKVGLSEGLGSAET